MTTLEPFSCALQPPFAHRARVCLGSQEGSGRRMPVDNRLPRTVRCAARRRIGALTTLLSIWSFTICQAMLHSQEAIA